MAAATIVPGNAGRADYPRMLYHGDGRTLIVDTPEEHDQMAQDGWEQTPSPIHTAPKPTPSGVLSGGDPLGALIRDVLEAVLDERGVGRRRTR